MEGIGLCVTVRVSPDPTVGLYRVDVDSSGQGQARVIGWFEESRARSVAGEISRANGWRKRFHVSPRPVRRVPSGLKAEF